MSYFAAIRKLEQIWMGATCSDMEAFSFVWQNYMQAQAQAKGVTWVAAKKTAQKRIRWKTLVSARK